MEVVRDATVSGFNEFIAEQRKSPGECSVKLVQFDTEYEVVFDKPLADVPKLTNETFEPRGCTALYDAQGKTIVALGQELAGMREEDRPGLGEGLRLDPAQHRAIALEEDARRGEPHPAGQRGVAYTG